MSVVHCDSGSLLRGGQWQALYLAEGMLHEGNVSRLLVRHGSPLKAEALSRGVPVSSLNAWSVYQASRSADLVHAHDAYSHTLAAAICKCPLIVSRRVAFPVRKGSLSRWKYARAAHFIAVSRHVGERLAEAGIPQGRISIVPDGVPLVRPACGTRLLAPATDDPRKGSALAARAATAAGVPVHYSSNLIEDLVGARVFLYLTYSEGLGSGILLAMASGLPVVASRVGGIPEIVEDGVTGILVDNDLDQIAAAVRRLWDDPELARAMGQAARRRVRENFTVEHVIRRTQDIYRQVLSS